MRIPGRITALLVGISGCWTWAAEKTAMEKEQIAKLTVAIVSSKDHSEQRALFYCPPGARAQESGNPVPLLVALHTWSSTFDQCMSYFPAARDRGWAMIAPDFRGPNQRPEACASELAIQDILDAVAYAQQQGKIDSTRIYLVGGSGGGHMSLMMAAKAPGLWAAVSAWCPISDLAAWHCESLQRKHRYAEMLEKSCGGAPGPETLDQYRARSPLFHLVAAKDLPLDINTGIHDGHTGSVPISHTIRAFNVLAQANGQGDRCFDEEQITILCETETIPVELLCEAQADPERSKAVHLRRVAGSARVTIFEGGHEQETPAALAWLARQKKGSPADFSLGSSIPAKPGSAQEVAK